MVEIRHSGFTGTSRSVEAVGTAIAGYGTDFSACWIGQYQGTLGLQGNFSVTSFGVFTPLNLNDFSQNNLQIAPNPASDFVNIKSQVLIKNIKVFNVFGQLVLENKLNNTDYNLNISNLSSGTYLMFLSDGQTSFQQKLIVK